MRLTGCCLAMLLFSVSGCAGLDRESYSLFYRKPAHQYRKLDKWQREELERYETTRINPSDGFTSSVAYEAFRPFTYCHRHQSYHIGESVSAFALFPVEAPASVSLYMGGIGARGIGEVGKNFARGVSWLWGEVFGRRTAPTPNREQPERPARQ